MSSIKKDVQKVSKYHLEAVHRLCNAIPLSDNEFKLVNGPLGQLLIAGVHRSKMTNTEIQAKRAEIEKLTTLVMGSRIPEVANQQATESRTERFSQLTRFSGGNPDVEVAVSILMQICGLNDDKADSKKDFAAKKFNPLNYGFENYEQAISLLEAQYCTLPLEIQEYFNPYKELIVKMEGWIS